MLFVEKDSSIFQGEKEYIDTLVVPLAPITFGEKMKRAAEQAEYVDKLCKLLEKQFRGRMFVIPTVYYPFDSSKEEKEQFLQSTRKLFYNHSFTHTILVTCDTDWNGVPLKSDETLAYIPSVTLEHMSDSVQYSFLESQMKEFMPKLQKIWA